MARAALLTASIAFVVTGLIGLYFLSIRGLALLPLGLLGLFLILAYTIWLAYNPVLCLLAPGMGFGILMVVGTHVALTGQYSWTAFIASLVPFFLVNNLLLLNQFPDVEADQSIGRRHFPLTVGRHVSSFIYGAFLLLAYVAILAGVGLGQLPLASLIGLGTVVIAVPAFVGAVRYAEETQKLIPYLGLNVIINIVTPALVGVGLLVR
jgi:1,4-dihydroxy-2-naphthoate octaprenyltransferase